MLTLASIMSFLAAALVSGEAFDRTHFPGVYSLRACLSKNKCDPVLLHKQELSLHLVRLATDPAIPTSEYTTFFPRLYFMLIPASEILDDGSVQVFQLCRIDLADNEQLPQDMDTIHRKVNYQMCLGSTYFIDDVVFLPQSDAMKFKTFSRIDSSLSRLSLKGFYTDESIGAYISGAIAKVKPDPPPIEIAQDFGRIAFGRDRVPEYVWRLEREVIAEYMDTDDLEQMRSPRFRAQLY